MADDVIANAAVEFITANERHMELAYKIEEVVPTIRERAIETVLARVEDRLVNEFGKDEWDVKFIRGKNHCPHAVRVIKKSWMDRFEFGSGKEWRGIRVVANSYTGWGNSNISVTPLNEVETSHIKEVFRTSGLGTSSVSSKYHYVELRGELKNWNGADFAIRAWKGADGIAEELADMIVRLCVKFDELFMEHRG